MKKRLLLKLGLVALLGVGLFVAWMWWTEPKTGVCRYTANRITVGMTEDDVTAIIGFSAGDYTTGPIELQGRHGETARVSATYYLVQMKSQARAATVMGWLTDDAGLIVEFHDGRVKACYLEPFRKSLTYSIRRWLHLN